MSDNREWMVHAACRDTNPEVFFPTLRRGRRPDGQATTALTAARKVCAGCPVINNCADYALAMRIEFGVWGGLSEQERHAIPVHLHGTEMGYRRWLCSCARCRHAHAVTQADRRARRVARLGSGR